MKDYEALNEIIRKIDKIETECWKIKQTIQTIKELEE